MIIVTRPKSNLISDEIDELTEREIHLFPGVNTVYFSCESSTVSDIQSKIKNTPCPETINPE
jgi:hypothetical protein